MFEPRDRKWALAVIAGIVGLMVWWDVATVQGHVGYQRLRDPPEGSERTLSLVEVVEVLPPGGYIVRKSGVAVEVRGDPSGLVPGQEWTVHGVFEGGVLQESWRVPAPGRGAKKVLGILGLALAAAVGVASVRVTPRGLVLHG